MVLGWGMSKTLGTLAAVTAVLLLDSTAVLAASETTYPARPIRLVLPYPPGGGIDALARLISPKLTSELGQQWVVDNRSGAAGNLAIEIVTRAAPDGHTVLLILSTALTVNPLLYKNLPFDVLKDLQPVTVLGTSHFPLVVHPSVPATSLKEFIALAKAKPGQLNYASAGVGGLQHFLTEQFKARTGLNIVHVPYKGGGPAALAVVAGEVQMVFASISASQSHIESGRLRALGFSGLQRSPNLPDVPTLDESGIKGFDVGIWYGMLVPTGTPDFIVNKLHKAVVTAVRLPEIREAMVRQGQRVRTSTPQELTALMKQELSANAEIVRKLNVKAE